VLDQIPPHVEVLGDVLDGHEAGQFQCVMFKGLGIAPALIRKPNPDLSDQTAGLAMDTRNLEVNDHRFASDVDGSSNEGCPSVDVSPNPERMVQQAGGHAVSPM